MANALTRYNTGSSLMPLSDAMDQLFQDAFTWPRVSEGGRRVSALGLSSNLYDTNESYIMQVLLPAADAQNLTITAHQNIVTIQGKTQVTPPDGSRVIWQGVGAGDFREQVTLPGEVDGDRARADYDNGVLTLTLPKAERARIKTIQINQSHESTRIEGNKS